MKEIKLLFGVKKNNSFNINIKGDISLIERVFPLFF